MTARRHLPLPIDRLPLYATDRELAPAIMGERAAEWPARVRFYIASGRFPRINALMGGRYVPAVIAFFDGEEGIVPPLPRSPLTPEDQAQMGGWILPPLRPRRTKSTPPKSDHSCAVGRAEAPAQGLHKPAWLSGCAMGPQSKTPSDPTREAKAISPMFSKRNIGAPLRTKLRTPMSLKLLAGHNEALVSSRQADGRF